MTSILSINPWTSMKIQVRNTNTATHMKAIASVNKPNVVGLYCDKNDYIIPYMGLGFAVQGLVEKKCWSLSGSLS